MSLRIHTLGPFRVYRDDTPVPDSAWKTQKNKSLLKILLTHRGHAPTKDQLMEWLWRDLAPRAAGRNLRVAVSQLRRVLEPDLSQGSKSGFVLTTDAGYTWNTEADYWLDAEEFERLADSQWPAADGSATQEAISHLQSAKSLYQGDYLEEDRYADWAMAERERLRELYFALLTRMAEAYARQGRYRRAVTTCREVLAANPCRESAWCALMLYHYHAGEQALALRAYEGCRKALDKELSVEPLPETAALYERILRREVPPLLQAIPNNLPHQLTSFIGREAELAGIAERLGEPSCQLLSLVGLGGIGKTRLAIQAAAEILERFPQGVYFVPLAPLSSTGLIVPTIAEALNLPLFGREDPEAQLLNYLREKEMLLVLDNFEHLLERAGLLIEILQRAPGVKILVTSREPLNLQAEWRFDVEGLPYPADGDTREIERYGSVQLFLERAARVQAGFSLTEATARDVIRICQFLEGMPLGIELAAVWVREFSCREIAREIEHNRSTTLTTGLDFLATSMRDVPRRHRGLRAVFDWSWNLLSGQEQRAFSKFSAFRGGFRIEAAKQVAGASLPLLSALVDKSLLRRGPSGQYDMHQLLQQYAQEQLQADPLEEERVHELHCEYYARYLHQREGDLKAGKQKETLEEIGEEIENVRKAWQWAIENSQEETIGELLEGLYLYYDMRSLLREANEAFGWAVEVLRRTGGSGGLEAERDRVMGKVCARQAMFCFRLDLLQKARALLQEGLAIFRRLNDRREMAVCFYTLGYMLGVVANTSEEYQDARELLHKSLAIFKELGEGWRVARVLNALGYAACRQGEYEEAKQLHQDALAIAREIGDRRTLAHILDYLGRVTQRMGEYREAKQLHEESLAAFKELDIQWGVAEALLHLQAVATTLEEYAEAKRLGHESLAIYRQAGILWGMAASLSNLGLIAQARGEYTVAKLYHQEALAVCTKTGDQERMAEVLCRLGAANYALGNYQEAEKCFHEALKVALDIRAVPLALDALVGIATLLARAGEVERALTLLAFTLHQPTTRKETRDSTQHLLSDLESRLPPEAFAKAQQRATARTLEQVVEEILAHTLER